MSLPVEDVNRIINGKGMLKFITTGYPNPSAGGVKADVERKICNNYKMASAKINVTDITLTATREDDPNANAVNVCYEADWATIGSIMAPGYIYTDSMSGCVFYLYRGFATDVHGVHASRQSGKLIDPQEYFTRRGGTLLYTWDSKGKLIGKHLGAFGAVFCCIDQAAADIFAVALRDRVITEVFEHTRIDDWRRA